MSTTHVVLCLRDADALGILFGTSPEGYVEKMSFPGVGGIFPHDVLALSSRHKKSLLSELLSASSHPISLKVISARMYSPSPPVNDKQARKFVSRQKYLEAAALFSLSREPLCCANQSSCLQLAGEVLQSMDVANRIVLSWPLWEMGYARKFSCLLQLQDVHGAIRCLSLALEKIPQSYCFSKRLTNLVLKQEEDVMCCLGEEEGTVLSVFKPHTTVPLVRGDDGGGWTFSTEFHPLIPVGSQPLFVNGLPIAADTFPPSSFGTEVAWIVRWKTTLLQPPPPPPLVLPKLEKSLPPTCLDTVLVFGSGLVECNGVYHPQGTRNEHVWFENEHGCSLSVEQGRSGRCAWVIGQHHKQRLCYVLKPGLDPLGTEATGSWIATENTPLPVPVFVGANTEKKLTLSAAQTAVAVQDRSMDDILSAKGHGIRLIEGGWFQEGIDLLETSIRYPPRDLSVPLVSEVQYWIQHAREEIVLFQEALDSSFFKNDDKDDNEEEEEDQMPLCFTLQVIGQKSGFDGVLHPRGRLVLSLQEPVPKSCWCMCFSPKFLPVIETLEPSQVDFFFSDREMRLVVIASSQRALTFEPPPPEIQNALEKWKCHVRPLPPPISSV